ncbi:MAG: GatB/YqeY domain-containing protein [Hyphomicrobiaceae bacterium]|nr:GatB/YqeY domain-containing protein [Hyphomicrobiaceae bacterium]
MREKINQALKAAMKGKEKTRIGTLRLINAAIKDREIAARSKDKDGVSDDEILEILARMVKQRRDSITAYEEGGRPELAAVEQAEIDIVTEFLPKQLNDDEIREICKNIIAELEATGLKDMGRTMGELKERYAGQMDFGKASRCVKEMLG